MESERRNCSKAAPLVSGLLANCDRAMSDAAERDRRTRPLGREGTMRRITAWHRTFVVLAIGLLALAAPLVALAEGGGPVGH